MKIVLAVVVLLASIFDWLSFRSKEGQCWLILAILMSLIEVSLAVGITSFMFWALVKIKRANKKYFLEAETKTMKINLAIAAIRTACFLA